MSLVKRIFAIRANQDGTLDSNYQNGDKPPPVSLPVWGDLTAIQAEITSTYTDTPVSVRVRGVLSGTGASTVPITIQAAQGDDAAATGWGVSGDTLGITSTTLGAGQFALVAQAASNVVSPVLNYSRISRIAPPPITFKWRPNIYLLHTTIDSDLATFVQTARTLGRGVAIWCSWAALEATQGNYVGLVAGSQLMKNVGYCEAAGVPYLVQVQDRSFGGSVRYAPTYVSRYQKINSNGSNAGTIARVWDPTTMGQWLALLQALSDVFDSRTLFMGFRGEETDIGFSTNQYAAAGFDENVYLAQMLRQNTFLTTVFLHSMKFIGANFMGKQTQLETLAKDIYSKASFGLAVMGSDLIPGNRNSWAYQVFIGNTWGGSSGWVSGGTDYRGRGSYNAQVQDPEMGGKAGNHTPSEFVIEGLAILCNYIVVFDKNYAYPLATGNLQPNQQTYWDSSLAANDTFRWRQMLAAHPEWATYQTQPASLSI